MPTAAERLADHFVRLETGDIPKKLLADAHKNVLVVGDDAQSIYSFRGATIRNILEFPEQFPGCRVITLEENFRSTQAILNVANEILHRSLD